LRSDQNSKLLIKKNCVLL